MEVITAASNPHVKALRSLYERKGRKERGQYVVEGVNIVKDIPETQRVDAYFVATSKKEELLPLVKDKSAPVYLLEDDLMARVAEQITPSGIIAVLPYPDCQGDYRLAQRLAVLDGVADPGNVGTILRSAVAAGFEDVLILGGADPYSPKVVRASMGGVFSLRIYTAPKGALEWDHDLYLLDMGGSSLFDERPRLPYALVVGSEASGADEMTKRIPHHTVAIPMEGGIESLNAAVAMATAMFVFKNNEGR